MKIYPNEWRLIALAAGAFMIAMFLLANEKEGGEAAIWYIYLIIFWLGLALFAKGDQGIDKRWKRAIVMGGAMGGLFMFMNMWQPSIFRLGFPQTIESVRFWVVGVLAPVAEELAFRQGLYLMVLRQRFGFIISAVINSVIFAMFHWYAYGLGAATAAYIGAFSFGMIACYLTEKTDNCAGATVTHMVVNIFQLMSMTVVVGMPGMA